MTEQELANRLVAPFIAIVQLAERRGVSKLCDHAGCWEVQVDARWWFALNGHEHEMTCSHGGKVPPFTALVEYNGWPAGYVDPTGGILASGAAANEQSFIAALEAAPNVPRPARAARRYIRTLAQARTRREHIWFHARVCFGEVTLRRAAHGNYASTWTLARGCAKSGRGAISRQELPQ